MIISRTPLRVSFVGGGSDLPVHYRRYGGAVLSAAIAKYVYITVNRRFDQTMRVSYSITEEVDHVRHIQHKLVRTAMEKLGLETGLEITSIAEIPSRGTGLGSSSAFTAGLLHALYAYQGSYRSGQQLAAEACEVEIDLCGEPIGKQDQYATAVGGVNLLRFNPDDSVTVEPVAFPPGFALRFESSFLLFYSGVTRSASEILRRQSAVLATEENRGYLVRRMAGLTETFRHAIQAENLAWIGEMLHEGWELKRSITYGISTGNIDDMYQRARAAGALGGKLLGAGGGGFLLVCASPERHAAIRRALSECRCFSVRFDWSGSSIVQYWPDTNDEYSASWASPAPFSQAKGLLTSHS
jgi:D-glycero-alpha-D-manno-heptose-7-phosphate kinase